MATIRRVIFHLRIRSELRNHDSLFLFLRDAVPFYERTSGITIRLFQSIDDPSRLIEVVEYESRHVHDLDKARIESDPQMQAYLERWHTFLAGPVEIETYQDITDAIRRSPSNDYDNI